jgi:hypothetical protein
MQTAMPPDGLVIKILFLAANPRDTDPLRLDQEVRAIDEALRKAAYRDSFDLIQHSAVRVGGLQGLLLRHQPHIVHLGGLGNALSEIILEDSRGSHEAVPSDAHQTAKAGHFPGAQG